MTDDLLHEVAADGGLDGDALADRRGEPWVDAQLEASRALAKEAGVEGTPSFQLGPTDGPLELVRVDSLGPEALTPAIADLLSS